MGIFYRILYEVGFTPWESGLAQERAAEEISAMFDDEEIGRQPPYGSALDLGCGSGVYAVNLAVRGWQVTGVDNVPRALRNAHERARNAGVDMRFIEGDIAALSDLGVGSGFRLVLDFGRVAV
jgi:methylase of polypeptide subunit release factors